MAVGVHVDQLRAGAACARPAIHTSLTCWRPVAYTNCEHHSRSGWVSQRRQVDGRRGRPACSARCCRRGGPVSSPCSRQRRRAQRLRTRRGRSRLRHRLCEDRRRCGFPPNMSRLLTRNHRCRCTGSRRPSAAQAGRSRASLRLDSAMHHHVTLGAQMTSGVAELGHVAPRSGGR